MESPGRISANARHITILCQAQVPYCVLHVSLAVPTALISSFVPDWAPSKALPAVQTPALLSLGLLGSCAELILAPSLRLSGTPSN